MNAQRQIQNLGILLLLWSGTIPVILFLAVEAGAVNRASGQHQHVKDDEQRQQLMDATQYAERIRMLPFIPVVLAIAGVNAALAVFILRAAYSSAAESAKNG